MPPVPKERGARLRASCDGCFLAKVKCTKDRPMCRRCRQIGLECNYSPTSRARKQTQRLDIKQSSISSHQQEAKPMSQIAEGAQSLYYPPPAEQQASFPPQQPWDVLPSESPSSNTNTMMNEMSVFDFGDASGFERLDLGMPQQTNVGYPPQQFWDFTSNEPNTSIADPSSSGAMVPMAQTQPFNFSMPFWGEQSTQNIYYYPRPPQSPLLGFEYLPSPIEQPTLQKQATLPDQLLPHTHNPTTAEEDGCFIKFMDSFIMSYRMSTPEPASFDTLRDTNHRIIDACGIFASCKACVRRFGINASGYLLNTMFYKIIESCHSVMFEKHILSLGGGFSHGTQSVERNLVSARSEQLLELTNKLRTAYYSAIVSCDLPNKPLTDRIREATEDMLLKLQNLRSTL
ncbi:hypothetical protein F4808DRAFT_439049 [Astrocystis sublimbata]|nr:hypothetical protein F4808DRAFT_439049 [Astrocystis sublimbata]